jgi:zinc protease
MTLRGPILGVLGAALLTSATSALALLPIEHWETSTGARVYFVRSDNLPMVDVSVEFPAGSGRDTSSRSGLAALTLRLLRGGTDELSEEEVSRSLAAVGANLGQVFDFDRSGLSLRSLSDDAHLTPALVVLADVLQRPSFPSEALEREKARVLAGIQETDAKPAGIASRTFVRLVYREHPYGLRASGEAGSVTRLTRADLADFHARFFNRRDAVVAIMGDVTRSRAEAIAEQLTRGLPEAREALPPLPPVAPLDSASSRYIAHGSAQAHIFLGAPGMTRSDPDYIPLWVGNYMLGGSGFGSRLTEELREKRGLTYSVYSSFSPYEQAGVFQIGLQTRSDQASEALEAVRETLGRFIAEGPAAQELERAKQSLVGGFPLRIDSNRKIHEYLGVIGFYRLPLDYLDRFPARIQAVTADEIRDAFQRRVHPDRMVTVVVGGVEAK